MNNLLRDNPEQGAEKWIPVFSYKPSENKKLERTHEFINERNALSENSKHNLYSNVSRETSILNCYFSKIMQI